MSRWNPGRTTGWCGLVALMVLLPLAAPSSAASAGGCAAWHPVEPGSDSKESAEALDVPVVKLTDAHTAAKPLKIEHTHGPAAWALHIPIVESTQFFNFQVVSKRPLVHVAARLEWPAPGIHDLDMAFFFNGTETEGSKALNYFPQDPTVPSGGQGYESIGDIPMDRCAGFTIESRGYNTTGTPATLKVWLEK